MTPQLVEFVCPKCGLVTEALAGSRVTHDVCAAARGKAVRMTPTQPTRKDPTR